MKNLLAGITLAAFVCVGAVQAGEGKDCDAKAKSCEAKTACCAKVVKQATSPKGAQQVVQQMAKR